MAQNQVQVLFSTNRKPGSVLIRAFTWSAFSHCDIVVGDGRLIGAVPFKGVISYPMVDRVAGSSGWALATFPGDPDRVRMFLLDQLGKGYDWKGVFGIGLHNRHWQDDDAWFCSELVAAAAVAGGQPIVNPSFPHARITPQDLLESPALSYQIAHPDSEGTIDNVLRR